MWEELSSSTHRLTHSPLLPQQKAFSSSCTWSLEVLNQFSVTCSPPFSSLPALVAGLDLPFAKCLLEPVYLLCPIGSVVHMVIYLLHNCAVMGPSAWSHQCVMLFRITAESGFCKNHRGLKWYRSDAALKNVSVAEGGSACLTAGNLLFLTVCLNWEKGAD